jgi:hypothetical protein
VCSQTAPECRCFGCGGLNRVRGVSIVIGCAAHHVGAAMATPYAHGQALTGLARQRTLQTTVDVTDDDGRRSVAARVRDEGADGQRGRRDVPTMYHAIGKQRGTPGNSGHLNRAPDRGKMGIYQGERLTLAEGS